MLPDRAAAAAVDVAAQGVAPCLGRGLNGRGVMSEFDWTADLKRMAELLQRSTDWPQARRVLHRTLADLHALEAAAIERRLGGRDG
jgi:hypothetical protein